MNWERGFWEKVEYLLNTHLEPFGLSQPASTTTNHRRSALPVAHSPSLSNPSQLWRPYVRQLPNGIDKLQNSTGVKKGELPSNDERSEGGISSGNKYKEQQRKCPVPANANNSWTGGGTHTNTRRGFEGEKRVGSMICTRRQRPPTAPLHPRIDPVTYPRNRCPLKTRTRFGSG